MDNLIQLLPDHIANQIAAGEVIQRPASVIKELMENAIDAGATKVEVNIKEAGKSLIQVVDNGGGMSPNDAVRCFERHATSKVRNADDLFALSTKGFRGEALASIAAIAHVEMRTKQADNELGTTVLIEGSTIVSNEASVCPNGTSFEIKNLFYNVPARRNFLKSNTIEFKHIQEEFERIALVHSDVHFTLYHNDSEIYNLDPAVLRKRIVDVLGRNTNDRLVPIEEKTDIVALKGFVLKPEFSRKTRGEQYLFVNDRFFKSHYFHHALSKAFEGLIKEKTFPGYFLYLTVDPSKIDVNVHPTKTEIKFEEEKFIYAILLSSVRQALGKYNIAPTLDFDRETSFDIPLEMRSQPVVEPTIQVNTDYNPFNVSSTSSSAYTTSNKGTNNFTQAVNKHGFGQDRASSADWENFYAIEETKMSEEDQTKLIEDPETTAGEFIVKGNYILSPSKSGLMVIHARRAIEQIVYSDLIKKFISSPIESQQLLFPIELELSKNEEVAWNDNATMLLQLGFHGTAKDGTLTLSATPSVLQEETINKALERIVTTLAHRAIEKGEIAHELVHTIARSAAQKKLNLTNNALIKELVEQLFQCENHTFTPGNKKIIDTLSIDIIDQNFK